MMVDRCRGGVWAKWVGVFVLCLCLCCCWSADAFGLSVDRAYEMVSPVYKGGYGANGIGAVAPNGESVYFASKGAFAEPLGGPSPAGSDYLARRDASGWTTSPLMVPNAILPYVPYTDVSKSLDLAVALGKPGPNNEGAASLQSTEAEFLLHSTNTPDIEANWEVGGMSFEALDRGSINPAYRGASGDLCHLLFTTTVRLRGFTESVGDQELYEVDRGCGGNPSVLRVVGLNNQGEAFDKLCVAEPGGREGGSGSTFNALADGGREIFFTTNVEAKSPDCFHGQLFVRLDGTKTLEVSKRLSEVCEGGPAEVPCRPAASTRPNATFAGASEDGSRVYFTTTAPLVENDEDTSGDLYIASIGCPGAEPPEVGSCEVSQRQVSSLVQVSHDPTVGEAAGVQGVVRVSPDGQRVYFVAMGDLLNGSERAGLEAEGRAAPHAGADNLYVYDSASGKLAFVADLCSGPSLSGSVEDQFCPSDLDNTQSGRNDRTLWANLGAAEAQTAGPDGGFLVFSSYGQLTVDDTDTSQDVFRYDAETGVLQRVSVGEAGHDANGNANGAMNDATIALAAHGDTLVQEQYDMGSRAVSEDGSRIVFTTPELLSPAATNRLVNVYEWHGESDSSEGRVSLISTGNSEKSVEQVVISPEGNDVFFVTSQGLVPQDTDGLDDVYDARLHGGFPVPPAARERCSGDACQGPLTNPAPLLVAGSFSQAPGGNFASPRKVASSKAKKKPKASKTRKRRGKTKRAVRARRHRRARIRGVGR